MHGPYQRDFTSDDDYGPGWRRARRDSLSSDTPPDADDLSRRGRPDEPRPGAPAPDDVTDPNHLAAYGYAGQDYPIYGRPSGLDPQSDPEPRWFADPAAIAYASGAGFTPPLIRREPRGPREGSHYGKGPRDYVRADSRIREDVCDRLSDDDEIDASDISVSVQQGEVQLEGRVADRHDKRRAERIALGVRGVIDVRNELQVNKTFFQELGDKLVGDDTEHRGHHGSGTRNEPVT
jgi:hypothetical protein